MGYDGRGAFGVYKKTSNHLNGRTTDKAASFPDERLDVMTVIRCHRMENRNIDTFIIPHGGVYSELSKTYRKSGTGT